MELQEKPLANLNVAIWDADFIPFFVCYNKKPKNEKTKQKIKTFNQCLYLANKLIDNINKQCGVTRSIMCFTSSKHTFRNEIDPEYKANRKQAVIIPHSREIRNYLMKQDNALFNPKYEADDIVVSLNKITPNSFVISPDKDVLGTEGYRFNPKTHKWFYTSPYDETVAFWKSMITGDTTDNISGLKGKGAVYAQKLIEDTPDINNIPGVVLNEYCSQYGYKEGVKQFNKNYSCLLILNDLTLDDITPKISNELEVKSELQNTISEG